MMRYLNQRREVGIFRQWFRIKVAEKIIDDLDQLKAGQEEIQAHLTRQDVLLLRLLEENRPPEGVVRVVFWVTNENGSVIEEATAVEMKIMQNFTCTVTFEDQGGNPAQVDDPPTWSVDPAGVLMLEPAADGLSVKVLAGTKVGSAQLLCKADANLDVGVTEITGMLTVTVLPGDAATITLNPGVVEDTPQSRRGNL